MSARFREVSPSAGVDEDQQGMIIPAGGSNTVLLEGGKGFKLTTDIPKLQIDIDKAPVSSATVARPAIKIRLTDKSKARSTGTVTAKNHKTREVVVLRVTVLPPKPISLAVKPVLIRMTGILTGAFAIHCKQPFDDIPGMVKTMNSIWTPQANVVFNFVQSTTRAEIDDPNPTVIFPTVVGSPGTELEFAL